MSTTKTEESRDALSALRIPRRDEPRKPPAWKRRLRTLTVLAVLLLIVAGGFLIARRNGWADSSAEWIPAAIRDLPEVRVAQVAVETGRAADAVVVATGYLESRRQAMIGARAAGRIAVVNVEEGSRVKEGEIMAVLEHKDMDAALAGAQASLERARAALDEQDVAIARSKNDFERITKLRQSNTSSQSEYDQARFQYEGAVAKRSTLEAEVKLAQARVAEAEQMLENMIIRAPFDGTVISKDAEVGESILPGGMGEASGRGSVVTIADLAHLEVDCDVKEDYISRVDEGAPAEVAVDAVPDRRYQGRVRKVIPMGDRARATIKVKVAVTDADERLFPDMSATVYFLPEPEDAPAQVKERRIFCDTAAIVAGDGTHHVWLVDDENRVQRVEVVVGEERDGRSEILDGLFGGEHVILNPPADLRPGQLVKRRE